MPTVPAPTRAALEQRLATYTRDRWPQLAGRLATRYRGAFAYLTADLPDGTTQPLCRLRYAGSVHEWGFAIYLASRDGYEDSVLPSGYPAGTPEEALDCACGLYLQDPTAWLQEPPRD